MVPAGSCWPRSAGASWRSESTSAGFRSHSALLAGVAAFAAVTAVALGLGPVTAVDAAPARCGRVRRCVLRDARALQAPLRRPGVPVTGRRLRIAGLHHVTLLCKDVERSVDFYRNLLGMRLVKQTVNEDDRGARHLFFGDEEGRPGTLITCLEYPELDEGSVGRGSTHHFALSVESEEELGGWRDYLSRAGHPGHRGDGPDLLQVRLPARPRRAHRGARDQPGPGLTADEPLEGTGPKAGLGERRTAGLSPAAHSLCSGQAAVSARSESQARPAPDSGGCAARPRIARRRQLLPGRSWR